YLLLALSIATYRDLAQRRDRRAGAWWAIAVLVNPQLFVVGSAALAVYLVRARRWSAIATATLVSIVAVVVSALLLPGWWTPWLAAVASRRLVRSTQQPTLAGLAGDVAGETWPLAWAVALALWLSAFPRYHDTGSGLLPPLAIALLAFAAARSR